VDDREKGCEGGRWMKLDQDCVQWRALVFGVIAFSGYRSIRYVLVLLRHESVPEVHQHNKNNFNDKAHGMT